MKNIDKINEHKPRRQGRKVSAAADVEIEMSA